MNTGDSEPDDLLAASMSGDDLPAEQISLALLAKAKRGDDAALHELVERYQERLHRIVRIQLGNSPVRRMHDSMDLVQNTFLAAMPKIKDLEPRSAASLLHWLSLIATNQIRDAHDHVLADKRDVRRAVSEGTDNDAGRLPDNSAKSPASQAQLSEVRELLDRAVAELPEAQRRVVLLRDYCGESWERVAKELHREQGAARQLHQRAWIRLRRTLRPLLEGGSERDS